MQYIDGRAIAKEIFEQVRREVENLDFQPVFCDVLVGADPVSEQYVHMKELRAQKVGLTVHHARFPVTITTEELVTEIKKINTMPNMCGLIIQLPLPNHIDTQAVLDTIDPAIDVDVLGAETSERFYNNDPLFVFPTAQAVLRILESLDIDVTKQKVAMVGQGRLVGKPVTFLLQQQGVEVEVIDKETKNPQDVTRDADIVISAVGKEALITDDVVKEGSIIIDAGTSEEDGNVVGDVDTLSVSKKVSVLSPVPGGVGPVTVAMLFKNVLLAAQRKRS